MKSRTFQKIAFSGLLLTAVVLLLAIPMLTVEVTSEASHQFNLNTRMSRVRKILVRTNAVKKIVAMADATLLDQEWQNMAFASERPLIDGQWHVKGAGQLSIEINDGYLGQQNIQLDQKVDIRPERLFSANDLAQPSESIKGYASTLELVPVDDGNEDENALVKLSLKLKVRTTASLLTRGIVQHEIRAAAKRSLGNQEAAIRELVDKQKGKLIILPDLGRIKPTENHIEP